MAFQVNQAYKLDNLLDVEVGKLPQLCTRITLDIQLL